MIKKTINCLLETKANYQSRKKLTKVGKSLPNARPDKKLESEYLQKWKKLAKSPSVLYPRYYAAINGIKSSLYAPENIYYTKIEPVLNNRTFAQAYADKNFYEKFLANHKAIFPNTILRGINGNRIVF